MCAYIEKPSVRHRTNELDSQFGYPRNLLKGFEEWARQVERWEWTVEE